MFTPHEIFAFLPRPHYAIDLLGLCRWTVGGIPAQGGAFYSPWLGIEASDNLNLIQPVNPWVGNGWSQYIEYYQWEPTYNYDSNMNPANPGDVLHGVVTFNPANQSYTIVHTNLNSGWSVEANIDVQKKRGGGYKNYTIVYIVFEKPAACNQYPPEASTTASCFVHSLTGKHALTSLI
jgi:hypothetical protein